MKGTHTTKIALASALVAGIALSTTPADAISYNVSGELNTGGHLIQYPVFRNHSAGAASLEITKNVETHSRFGLRNSNKQQVTRTLQYNSPGWQSWGHVPTGRYALNGRMGAKRAADNDWRGVLTL